MSSMDEIRALKRRMENQPHLELDEADEALILHALKLLLGVQNDVMHADYAFSVGRADKAKYYTDYAVQRFKEEHPLKPGA